MTCTSEGMYPAVYLEAPTKTQELLTLKWHLLAAGFRIVSTWHDEGAASAAHWNRISLEQLRNCDALVVVSDHNGRIPAESALLMGLAAGFSLPILCLGKHESFFDAVPHAHAATDSADIVRQLSAPAPHLLAA